MSPPAWTLAPLFFSSVLLSGCGGSDYVTSSAEPTVDCAVCGEIAGHVAACNLLQDVTPDEYEAICRDSAARLCEGEAASFVGLARDCLKRTSCSSFHDCYLLVVDGFKERQECYGKCG